MQNSGKSIMVFLILANLVDVKARAMKSSTNSVVKVLKQVKVK